MRSRIRVAGIFVVLAAVLVGWLVVSGRHGDDAAEQPRLADRAGEAGHPLDAVPDGALLVATIDVRALRRTALGERLLGGGRRIGGLGSVSEVCGADPMAGIDRLALAVPAAGSDTAFAVFATGRVDADALLRCAKTVIKQRGGRPVVSPMGRFQVLRDAAATEPGAELAVAPGGPVVLAQGDYLRQSIDAAEGRVAAIRRDPDHARLRQAVGKGVVVATVVLTDELRLTLARELAVQGSPDSPASAVTSGGLSLQLGTELSAHMTLQCDRPDACRDLAQLVDEARKQQSAALAPSQPALAAALRSAVLRAGGSSLHLGLSLPPERAASLLEALVAMAAPRSAHAEPAEQVPTAGDGGAAGPPVADTAAAVALPPPTTPPSAAPTAQPSPAGTNSRNEPGRSTPR